MDDLSGQRVTVMGLGRFGGGIGVTHYLAAQGCDVLVTDCAPQEDHEDVIDQIQDLLDAGTVTLRLGGHNVSDFTTCDLVIASPAVKKPWENRFLRAAQAAGVAVTTEIGMVIERLPTRERVIAVTGSAGKSTTAAMIAQALLGVGCAAHLGGNIGGSLLGQIDEIGRDDWVVLELSSAMLHWIESWSPGIAVVTNLSENHLDWHGSMEHYTQSKAKILASQVAGDVAVFGADDMLFRANEGVRVIGPTECTADKHEISLCVPGQHNVLNAVLAANAVVAATSDETGGTLDEALHAIESFRGLAHRLEFIGDFAGVRVYNDSKSTTPEAAIRAIDALEGTCRDAARIHLIAGGYDKHASLKILADRCDSYTRVWTIGETGSALAELIGPNAHACGDLDSAVEGAMSDARAGDVVLLSPACASWDQFANFEQRGKRFAAMVKEWACVHSGERSC